MAFTTTGAHVGRPVHDVYNIDWTVGGGGTNLREDVLLVQALFSILYYRNGSYSSDFQPPPGYDDIAVDGYFGPVTGKHIHGFQQQLVKRGMAKLQDGQMDPFRQYGQPSAVQKTLYALDHLNQACYDLCARETSSDYWMLGYAYGNWPPELINALRKRRDKPKQSASGVQQTVPTTGGA